MEISLDDRRILHLRERDKRLAKLINTIGPIQETCHEDGFAFLVCEIIGQMLSNKVTDVLIDRLAEMCNGIISIKTVGKLNDAELKSIGISSAKVLYITSLLKAVESGDLVLDEMAEKDDVEVIKELKKIKGIGNWTAKMFLLFVLGRQNVLPYEDGAFLQGYKWLYKTEDTSADAVKKRCKKWEPYSSIAVRYMYKAVDYGFIKKPFHLYKELEGTL